MTTPPQPRKPDWLKVRFPAGERYSQIKSLLREHNLHSVCEEADCPNIGECFNAGEATFIILGDTCTRACAFCNVKTGMPRAVDPLEPEHVATAAAELGLEHIVVTSVDRDDLPDGGAEIVAETIRQIRLATPGTGIEVLISDLNGRERDIRTVVEAQPDILGHNVETVPRLQRPVRRRARWDRSVFVLTHGREVARDIGFEEMVTKTGIMLGLGESWDEILESMHLLREADVDVLTIGQYLRPSRNHLPLVKYYTPAEFMALRRMGLELGFRHVQSGPLVRSSYHAAEQVPGRKTAVAS